MANFAQGEHTFREGAGKRICFKRHLDYIKKLSNAKGRELVPYKLDVYRALMSMELIKDKGRRPALTSLGQEISLFLQ